MSDLIDKLFTGETKYTVGIVFLIGNLAGYFLNMRKLKIGDTTSIIILLLITALARVLV